MSHGQRILNHPAGATGGGGGGAWAMEQGIGGGANNNTIVLQYPSNAKAGGLFVAVSYARGSGAGATIADDKSQTWTTQIDWTSGLYGSNFKVRTAPVTGTAVGSRPTVTQTSTVGGNWMGFYLGEFSGVDTSTSTVSVYATHYTPFQGDNRAYGDAGPTATSGAHEPGIIYGQREGGADVGTWTGYTEIARAVAVPGAVIGGVLACIESDSAPFTGQFEQLIQSVGEYSAIAFCLKRA